MSHTEDVEDSLSVLRRASAIKNREDRIVPSNSHDFGTANSIKPIERCIIRRADGFIMRKVLEILLCLFRDIIPFFPLGLHQPRNEGVFRKVVFLGNRQKEPKVGKKKIEADDDHNHDADSRFTFASQQDKNHDTKSKRKEKKPFEVVEIETDLVVGTGLYSHPIEKGVE